jgi:poly(hydroxyalkanoate) depolymerase family esterase
MSYLLNMAKAWLGADRRRREPPPAPARIPEARSPAPHRFMARSFANEAGTREYKLYVPTSYRGEAMPLIVMLHGCKQNADDFAAGTRMNEFAEELGFIVVYPEQARSANSSGCWNWYDPDDQKRDGGEPSIIAGITRQVMADYAVIPGRVFIAGLSAGGSMAAIMGTTYPDLYAAMGVHSGLPYGAADNLISAIAAMRGHGAYAYRRRRGDRPFPTIAFHGDRDMMVHPSTMQPVARLPSRLGWVFPRRALTVQAGEENGRRYTRTIRKDWKGKAMLEHWLVHGAGHAWSGGNPKGSYADPRGPDATRAMLGFFLQTSSV